MLKQAIRGGMNAVLLLVLLSVLMQGCAAVQYMDDQVTGNLYLRENRHQEGVQDFQARVRDNPEAHTSQYYLGRFLLASEQPEEALPHLQKAADLSPDNADYHYWLGVAYWALDDPDNERREYENALALDPDHLSARVYLGHNLLDSGDAHSALAQYNHVLAAAPGQPEALYNRAAALAILGHDTEALAAWRKYLDYYPEGSLAREAALNLNRAGNFAYRTQVIGVRQMVLQWVRFEVGTAVLDQASLDSLDAVGRVMAANPRFGLAINAFTDGNQDLARARAQSVKDYILSRFPAVSADRLIIEAYGRPERISISDKTYALAESIVFQTIPLGESS